jgi:hypothetical protein
MHSKLMGNFDGYVWPAIASVLIPSVQLIAVIIVDVNETLNLENLFLMPNILPIANIFALMLIMIGMGTYWYIKENYHWIYTWNTPNDTDRTKVPTEQKRTKNILITSVWIAIVSCITLIISLIVGSSFLKDVTSYFYVISALQVISYISLVSFVGFIAYVGLNEYSKKQKGFKPEQYLTNLRTAMESHGTIQAPKIHIKKRQRTRNNSMEFLIEIEINNEKKYLLTNYDGKEITQELTPDEYRKAIQQSSVINQP